MKSPVKLRSKLPKVGTTIFTKMSALANEHNAINLSQGFPNFDCDPALVSLASEYMQKGFNQYCPMQGLLSLRENIAAKVENLYGIQYNPDTEINITAGATQAIFTIISTVISEGDEVIIIEPAYDCYEPAIELMGGVINRVQLQPGTFKVNWTEVQKMVNQNTKLLIINTPHNPTGTILEESDMKQLEKIVKGNDLLVLSDEVYEHIIYDQKKHQSVCLYPSIAEKSFVVFSFGKTFHVTGWKMGYVLAPEHLMAEFRKVHQYNVFTCNTPFQYALAEYIKNENKFLELPAFYQEKRDYFTNIIKETQFEITPCSGTYFMLLGYRQYSDKGDVQFAEELTKKGGVASVPVSVFYGNKRDDHVLRFCFAKTTDQLDAAGEKLIQLNALV